MSIYYCNNCFKKKDNDYQCITYCVSCGEYVCDECTSEEDEDICRKCYEALNNV